MTINAADTTYSRNVNKISLKPGETYDFKLHVPLKSLVKIKINSNNFVIVNISSQHLEQYTIRGFKKFVYRCDPDSEIYLSIQCKKGLFAKSSDVSIEVELLAPKIAVELYNKSKNILSMLKEIPEYYELNKELIKDILKKVIDVWDLIGSESKQTIKELINIIKKLDRKIIIE